MKYLVALSLIAIAIMIGVITKTVYEPFTNSSGSIFEANSVDAGTTAIITSLPWIAPIMIFVIILILVIRRNRA